MVYKQQATGYKQDFFHVVQFIMNRLNKRITMREQGLLSLEINLLWFIAKHKGKA